MLDAAREAIAKGELGKEELKVTLHHFMMASFDTSSVALFCGIYCLARYPEIQEKLYQEIISVVPDDDTQITVEHLANMTYLDMVVSETLRLFPAGPMVARKATEDFKLSNGVLVPKGTNFALSFFHMHRNENIWGPDYAKYNPENFSEENMKNRDPNAFMPFAKGPRGCTGGKVSYWVLKIFLANTIRKHRFTTDFEFEKLKFEFGIVLRLVEYPSVSIKLRQ